MRTISVVFCITLLSLVARAFASSDEKIAVGKADVGRADVDVTLIADSDHRHFSLAGKAVDAEELKVLLTEQQRSRRLRYVLVVGDKVTFSDLAAVARVGKALGFTVLFEAKDSELRSLKLIK